MGDGEREGGKEGRERERRRRDFEVIYVKENEINK